MAYRTFVDAAGVSWEVWAVKLDSTERRSGRDRRQREPGESEASPDVAGRRRGDRRRLRDHATPRPRVSERFAGGWLAFECPTERRRLTPVPPGWEMATEDELRELCSRAAVPVMRGRAEG